MTKPFIKPYAGDDEFVFIGVEDGVAIYDKRKNLSGIDHAMMRDRMRRKLANKEKETT